MLRLLFLPIEFVKDWLALSIFIVIAVVVFTCVSFWCRRYAGIERVSAQGDGGFVCGAPLIVANLR
jgi:hypothetical protein